jgi:hypothetical protein
MLRSNDYLPEPTLYYFVCTACEAKWFATQVRTICPRCGRRSLSGEQLTPPWYNRTDNEREPTSADQVG